MVDMVLMVASGANESAPESVDWLARGLALASFLLSIVVFVVTQRGKRWRGRADALRDFEDRIEEVDGALGATEQNAANVVNFWTLQVSAAISELEQVRPRFPDAQMRRLVAALLAAVRGARGDTPPAEGQDLPPLSTTQRKGLKEARMAMDKIEARITKITLKGAVS